MTTDNLFVIIMFIGVYVCCLLLLDGAHKAHIAALKHSHREQVAGLRSYIRTLSRERLWLEAELARVKQKLEVQSRFDYIVGNPPFGGNGVSSKPEHIQWLPPSEEYDSNEE